MHGCVAGRAAGGVRAVRGHLSTIEQPDLVTSLLSRWLASTRPRVVPLPCASMHHATLLGDPAVPRSSCGQAGDGRDNAHRRLQLVQALQLHFDVVMDLGFTPMRRLPSPTRRTASGCRAHGAKYVHIPVSLARRNSHRLIGSAAPWMRSANSKVLVHCAPRRNESGSFGSGCGVLRQGWSKDAAPSETARLREPTRSGRSLIEQALSQMT